MQMVKHVIVHFRDEKSRKKSKLTHKNVEKHNPLIRLVQISIEMFITFLTGGQSDGQFDGHSEWISI